MTVKKVTRIKYTCDSKPRPDCWNTEEYSCHKQAKEYGWVTVKRKHYCPYCYYREFEE